MFQCFFRVHYSSFSAHFLALRVSINHLSDSRQYRIKGINNNSPESVTKILPWDFSPPFSFFPVSSSMSHFTRPSLHFCAMESAYHSLPLSAQSSSLTAHQAQKKNRQLLPNACSQKPSTCLLRPVTKPCPRHLFFFFHSIWLVQLWSFYTWLLQSLSLPVLLFPWGSLELFPHPRP